MTKIEKIDLKKIKKQMNFRTIVLGFILIICSILTVVFSEAVTVEHLIPMFLGIIVILPLMLQVLFPHDFKTLMKNKAI